METIKDIEYPFVSIIIPAKNEEKYIGRCLDAVIKLNYPRSKYEIILVDNHSTDNTREIARKFNSIILLEKKEGTIGAVRNFGAKHAKGDILAFLDGDCIPHITWLSNSIKILNNNIDVVTTKVGYEKKDATWVEYLWIEYLTSGSDGGIKVKNSLASFCFIIRKSTFLRVGGFDETLLTCEDSDLGYRLNKITTIICDNNIETIHLKNAKNISEFFKRQYWQGKGNMKSFLRHSIHYSEIPSVIVPFLYLMLYVMSILSMLLRSDWVFPLLLSIILIPFLLAVKSVIVTKKYFYLFQYYAIWITYITARSFANLFCLKFLYPKR